MKTCFSKLISNTVENKLGIQYDEYVLHEILLI